MLYESQYYGVCSTSYLEHHGVKGQKWGVRRYQYSDGSLTPEGYIHYGYSKHNGSDKTIDAKKSIAMAVLKHRYKKLLKDSSNGKAIGKQYVDTYLKKNTSFYRIQSNDNFENFAFFATYEKHDIEQYAGLFGNNLKRRADAVARQAEKEAKKSGDYSEAKKLRNDADTLQIHRLEITNTSKLKIPSDRNVSNIVGKLMKDPDFHNDLKGAITHAASIMKRPSQQMLFKEASKIIAKNKSLSDSEKSIVYKALNLTLTNHNEQEVRLHNRFYSELKKNGYSALLDLNDKTYSSYHAKSLVIVFDTDRVKLSAVTKLNDSDVNKLYKKYNRERIIKDIPEQLTGTLLKKGGYKISKISSFSVNAMNEYLR